MADKYQGEFYCVKCKAKKTTEGDVVIAANGRRMAKAVCPDCGTKLNRILGKA
jgi:ribosomal protein L34E